MQCQIHSKEMRQGTKGWYCPTPIKKTPDGKTVLEWCKWKPATDADKETELLQSRAIAQIQAKLGIIEEKIDSIESLAKDIMSVMPRN